MIFTFSAFGRGLFWQFGKGAIFAMILTGVLINGGVSAQTNLTREQFSRLNVRTRAGFFENEILRAAQIEGVDPNILWTIAYLETRFRPWLRSPKDARGLMQFIPATAARFGLDNPFEPVPAICGAARYVKVLSKRFGGRIDSVLAAYNSGEGVVSAYLYGRTLRTRRKLINTDRIKTIGGVPPYAETIQYVGRGLKIYRWLVKSGAFPAGSVRANFPTVLSAGVARVRVFDRELGNVPDNVPAFPQTSQNKIAEVAPKIVETKNGEENQNTRAANLTLIYYDSRTGSRYRLNNGKREKLADSGAVIVNQTSRTATTAKARSTFFAPPSDK
jgi:hypothetical protein